MRAHMRPLRLAAWAALLASLGLMAYGVAQGAVRVGFFLVVPYVMGTGFVPFLSMLLLMAAMALFFMSAIPRGAQRERVEPSWRDGPPRDATGGAYAPRSERRVKHGGVILLGPIPIVWGSDRKVLPWMIGAGAALLLLGLWLTSR